MKPIVFDFDGVIVYSIPITLGITQSYIPNTTIADYRQMFMGNIYQAVAKNPIQEPPGFDFQAIYRPKLLELSPLPEMVKMLEQLQRHDLIIISSTHSESIRQFLTKHNLIKYFPIILGEDIEKSKAVKFKQIADKFDSQEIILITDTVGDILEAEKLDMYSIGVTWGLHDRRTLNTASPDLVVDTAEELLTAINNCNP